MLEYVQRLIYRNVMEWWDVRDDALAVFAGWRCIGWPVLASLLSQSHAERWPRPTVRPRFRSRDGSWAFRYRHLDFSSPSDTARTSSLRGPLCTQRRRREHRPRLLRFGVKEAL
jgi:hypothetical protein